MRWGPIASSFYYYHGSFSIITLLIQSNSSVSQPVSLSTASQLDIDTHTAAPRIYGFRGPSIDRGGGVPYTTKPQASTEHHPLGHEATMPSEWMVWLAAKVGDEQSANFSDLLCKGANPAFERPAEYCVDLISQGSDGLIAPDMMCHKATNYTLTASYGHVDVA